MRDKQADVKERIIETSIKLFLANGFVGTTVKDITDAASVAKGTLYWYFRSKDEILEHILDKYSTQFVEPAIKKVESAEGDFRSRFNVFYRFATEFARDNRQLLLVFITLLAEVGGNGSTSEQKMKKIRNRIHLFFQDLLGVGRREGTVDASVDADIQSRMLSAFFMGMHLEWYLEQVQSGSMDSRAYSKAFRESILRGLAPGGNT